MKRTMLAATVTLAVSTAASAPAFGFHCPRDMKKIDDTLATKHHWMRSTSVSGSQLARIKALRADGERLHQSGKHEEAVEALAEAMKILGIEKPTDRAGISTATCYIAHYVCEVIGSRTIQ